MPTSPSDLLALAKRLQVEDDSEVSLRCAVSRSYYAALLKADATFPQRDLKPTRAGESSHEKIIGRAQVHGNGVHPGRTSALTAAKLLPKLKRTRVKSDYHLDDMVSVAECNEAIIRAESIMASCDDVAKKIQEAVKVIADTSDVAAKPTLIRTR